MVIRKTIKVKRMGTLVSEDWCPKCQALVWYEQDGDGEIRVCSECGYIQGMEEDEEEEQCPECNRYDCIEYNTDGWICTRCDYEEFYDYTDSEEQE